MAKMLRYKGKLYKEVESRKVLVDSARRFGRFARRRFVDADSDSISENDIKRICQEAFESLQVDIEDYCKQKYLTPRLLEKELPSFVMGRAGDYDAAGGLVVVFRIEKCQLLPGDDNGGGAGLMATINFSCNKESSGVTFSPRFLIGDLTYDFRDAPIDKKDRDNENIDVTGIDLDRQAISNAVRQITGYLKARKII